MAIVKDVKKLKVAVEPKKYTKNQIEYVSEKLKRTLSYSKGFGLSANQIGLDERICLIDLGKDEPMILVNPKIVDRSKKVVVYMEQCLSLDKTMRKPVKTIRHQSITVECDNLGTIVFSPDSPEGWKNSEEFWEDQGLLECVCAQHEIDHLNGKLITDKDRRYSQTVIKSKKYGRNERVMVKMPNGDTEFMKYKKAIPYLDRGCEIL